MEIAPQFFSNLPVCASGTDSYFGPIFAQNLGPSLLAQTLQDHADQLGLSASSNSRKGY
jgi:hypothetical protein